TSRFPAALALALVTLGTFGISCTAILAPRDDVQRCSNRDDCDPTGDNRYVPACKFDDENLDLDASQVDKICVADFKPSVGCDPTAYAANPEHPFTVAMTELGDVTRYAACTPEQLGARGCTPMAGGACQAGLVLNELGLCDDENPDTPLAVQVATQ